MFLSSIFFIYVFYRSTIVFDGLKEYYYKPYYLLSVIFIIFSFIYILTNIKIKKLINIIVVSFLISIYSFEIYINLRYSKVFDKDSKDKILEFDTLISSDKNLKPTIFPKKYLKKDEIKLFPLSGISNVQTLYCNENGYFSKYLSDRYGFNNPDFEWSKEIVEYVIVGDSFVHGACVNRPYDVSSVLRNITNKTVLNLGMGSNGPLLEYATIREYLPYNVKNIIWIYYDGGDIEDLINELKNKILSEYIFDENFSQNLKEKQEVVNKLNLIEINDVYKLKKSSLNNKRNYLKNLKSILKISYTREILNNLFLPNTYHPNFNQIPDEFFKIMYKLKTDENTKNSKIFFVYLPSRNEFSIHKRFFKKFDRKKIIKDELEKMNFKFMDFQEILIKNEKGANYYYANDYGGHFNVKGYNLLGQSISKFIDEN